MSAESESLLVIGGVFTLAAIILSGLLIAVRRGSLRFDRWLLRKIPLRLTGVAFYCWYAFILSFGLVLLGILYETRLFGPALLIAAGAVFLLAVGVAIARHRKSLRDRGIMLFKGRRPGDD
jgi:O-antigen/teichoic acid export membrane protein